jgi:hypothetical protein
LATGLRASLWGFKSLDEHTNHISNLYKVTKDDLQRVASKYFKAFLGQDRVTCITAEPSLIPGLTKELGQDSRKGYSIAVSELTLEQLKV